MGQLTSASSDGTDDRLDSSVVHRFALVPASYVYLRRGDEVLLQQRLNTGYMDGYWNAGVAGHVEAGETARQAAVREALEEIGVIVEADVLELTCVMQRTDGTDNPREQRIDWFWVAHTWEGEPRICEPHKTESLAWFHLGALPKRLPDYERYVLNALVNNSGPMDAAFGFRPAAQLR